MVDTFLFDMDGVLVDTEDLSSAAVMDFFKTKGVELTIRELDPYFGVSDEACFLGLAKLKGITIDLEEAREVYKKSFLERLSKTDVTLKGSKEFVVKSKELGFKIAVVSAAPLYKVEANLAKLGLTTDFFDTIISASDNLKNKPEPDMYLTAASRVKSDPSTCVVFEDSISGTKAGTKANMRVVGLLTNVNAELLGRAGSNYIISSFLAIPEFKSIEEFNLILEEELKSDDHRVQYGANWILPKEHRLLREAIIPDMIKKATQARLNAYTPYSNYKVGAAVLSARTGKIYSGCNVENSSYGATVCAERNAILHAIAQEGDLGIDVVVVVSDDFPPAPPCAQCLQVLAEFSKKETSIILVSINGESVEYKFSELLPNPFIFPTKRN